MRAIERLTLVAPGPGRSGADTVLRILSCHPSATVLEGLGPSLIADITQLMVHAPYDQEAWLPRRAAQALTNVVYRLDAAGDRGRSASAELTRSVGAMSIDIPVYGRLLLPGEFPLAHWGFLLRRALGSAAALTDATQLALKTGAYAAPVVCSLLAPTDSLIYTVRHPAETVIGLTESVVDGMRPSEAVNYVDLHLRQAKRLLAAAGCPSLVIRLEHLVSCTDAVLTELAVATKLPDEPGWRRAAQVVPPTDINCSPRWDHPAVRPHRPALAELANSWGYP